ncbi:MAG: glycerol-3-phosphate responsive antiterminator [Ruminococcaceae bacterium]|nr:glycerol-3-phosphate responsive antiterminator [Oscillospiraceae bacterium]
MHGKIIAAVRTEQELSDALLSAVDTVFYLTPSVFTLAPAVEKAHARGKKLFIHMDLTEGVGKDRAGLQLVKNMHADGIISTRGSIIKMAKEAGLFTVQRFFLVDSHSVETIVETIKSVKPDMAEIMPGVVPKVMTSLKGTVPIPIIAGGLIDSREEIEKAIEGGAAAVSIGKKEFWEAEK